MARRTGQPAQVGTLCADVLRVTSARRVPSRPAPSRPVSSRPVRLAVLLVGASALLAALALAAPAGALGPPAGQAATPAAPASTPEAEPERGPVGAAPPASPVPAQPRFTG